MTTNPEVRYTCNGMIRLSTLFAFHKHERFNDLLKANFTVRDST